MEARMIFPNKLARRIQRGVAVLVVVWLCLSAPVTALAQDAIDANGNPTGVTEDQTGPQTCTGAGCGQGQDQGLNQGENQGGPTAEQLGAVKNEDGDWVFPEGTEDTRQGASQGQSQGISAGNSNTGADSTNASGVDVNNTTTNSINNNANDSSSVGAAANTGGNTQNKNTKADGVTTGTAGIGVTQVKQDNTAILGGSAGLNVSGHQGNYSGDLNIGFGAGTADLSAIGGGIRAVNDTTGAGSLNDVTIGTKTETLAEIQNDGKINNILNLEAITGRNMASMNTSDGSIATGDANVAATLVNLLNTTVINGDIWLTVADIFGDLTGNIVLPDFAALASALRGGGIVVDAGNKETGSDSVNTIDIDVTDEEKTNVQNDAQITTTVNAQAITGQNDALKNTGGGFIETGEASVSASNISVANTTVEGGSWGLVIVNALNRWLGFLVGDSGEVRVLSQAETLREIEAQNSNTGADSTNTIDVDIEETETTAVTNQAEITNEVNVSAITGQNEASKNTGAGRIVTGDANVKATAVNIANTTVKNGSLFIAVVNVFGDWFGDLLYGDRSLTAQAGSGNTARIQGENSNTGSGSENTIDVDISRSQETVINNDANIETILNAEVDTGSNRANMNTKGGEIVTGSGVLALHSRALANLTGIALDPALGLRVTGLNDTTGFDSKNKIKAKLNDERVVMIDNKANVSSVFSGIANTGFNESNMNTGGGTIITGGVAANVGIHNLLNRVILAATAGEVMVDAEFLNRLTGALSENTGEVIVNHNFLAEILNNGVVNNLIDLLLNTGGNMANENTGGSSHSTGIGDGPRIVSGEVCAQGEIQNEVNTTAAGVGGSLLLGNLATILNDVGITAISGDNEMDRNTGGGQAVAPRDGVCGKIARAPEDQAPLEPAPMPEGGGDVEIEDDEEEEEENEVAEEEEDEEDEAEAQVAAVQDEAPLQRGRVNGGVLTRFPVAGGMAQRGSLFAQRQGRSPWVLFGLGSVVLLLFAYQLDQQARLGRFRTYSPN